SGSGRWLDTGRRKRGGNRLVRNERARRLDSFRHRYEDGERPDWKAPLRASELRLARQILRNPVAQFPAPGLGPRAFSFRARNRQGGTSLAKDSLRFARQQIQRPLTRVLTPRSSRWRLRS